MELNRKLKPSHATLIALGGMIGSAYFLGTGYLFKQIGPLTFLAFVLGGWIAYLTMQCQAEISAYEKPSHLSLVSYAKQYISPSWGCGVGWAYWTNWVVYIAAECLAGGILMEVIAPQLSVEMWATLIAIFITGVNLLKMELFGKALSWLTFGQIFLLIGFCAVAFLILLGWAGAQPETAASIFTWSWDNVVPESVLVFFFSMVILLNNYQGAEMIVLSASEVEDPQNSIPKALKKIGHQSTILLSFPLLLLALIFPWPRDDLNGNIFADVLHHHGFIGVAQLFTFVIIVVAFSSANSSLYANARTLHALASLNMAPKALQKLNKHQVPSYAIFVTAAAMLGLILCSYFFSSYEYYIKLLAISGFTGCVCWISICWSQLRFRKTLSKSQERSLSYKAPGYPYLTHFSIWFQVLCLGIIIYSPELRASVYFGLPCFLIPILFYRYLNRSW